MSTPLIPFAPDLWIAHADLLMAGKAVHFPLRMSVVRLPDGLALWSPIPIDDPLHEAITALGPVTDIIAPSGLHHLHAKTAHERFPRARLWLSKALRTKVPALFERGQALERAPDAWSDHLEVIPVEGMPGLDELVALHSPSRTLITTDLVFNMHETRGWLMPLILRLGGAWRRFGQSRLMRMQVKDPTATRASFERILALDFDRLLMAHGDPIESGARAKLAEALAWLAPASLDHAPHNEQSTAGR